MSHPLMFDLKNERSGLSLLRKHRWNHNHPGGSTSERSMTTCCHKKSAMTAEGKHVFLFIHVIAAWLVFCQSLVCSPFCSHSHTHTHCCFSLNGPVGRWAPAARLWTATSSRWRSAWCAPTWRETRCSGPADTSLPAPSAPLVWRSVSYAKTRSSPELR